MFGCLGISVPVNRPVAVDRHWILDMNDWMPYLASEINQYPSRIISIGKSGIV